MHPPNQLLATLSKLRPFLLTLLGGLLLAGLLVMGFSRVIQGEAQEQLNRITEQATQQIESRLNEQGEVLRGLQGAFIANPDLKPETFQAILDNQNILTRLAGFIAIGFSRQVEHDQLQTFTTAVRDPRSKRATAYLGYTVHPDTGLAHTQPVDYLYPVNTATADYLGLDLLSLTENRSALALSRDEGRGMTSPPFILGRQTNAPLGFMMHYPVYTAGPKPSNTAERRSRYRGSLTAIYHVDQMLSGMDAALQKKLTRIRLYDTGGEIDRATRRPEAQLVETRIQPNHPGTLLCSNKLINMPGRQWRLELCATPWGIAPQYQGGLWLTALASMGITLLLGTLLQTKKNAVDRARQWALDLTANFQQREIQCQQLMAIADQISDFIVIRNTNGQINYANQSAQNRFGREDKPLDQFDEPLLLSAELGELNTPLHTTSSHCDTNGTIHHYEVIVIPLQDADNQSLGTGLHAREITREIEQNDELHQQNERLADLMTLSNDWVWEQDEEGRFTHVTGGFFKIHEVNPAHSVELGPGELAQAGLSEAQWISHRKALDAHQPYRDFTFILRNGNDPLVISLSGKPVLDKAGYFVGYRGIGRDITALHQARLKVLAEKQRLIAILESLSDGVITTDLAGRVDYLNPVAIALTGREAQEALNLPIEQVFQVIDPVTRLPLPCLPRQTLATSHAPLRHRTAVLLNRFGLTFTIQEAVACILDEKGDASGSVVVFRDQSHWLDPITLPD